MSEIKEKHYVEISRKGDDDKDLTINGKSPYFRILIRNKKPLISWE